MSSICVDGFLWYVFDLPPYALSKKHEIVAQSLLNGLKMDFLTPRSCLDDA